MTKATVNDSRPLVAVYSGTFDPFHAGHAMVASYLLRWGGFDRVWILVSGLNPLKRDSMPGASDEERVRMATLAMEPDAPEITVSDFEMHLPRPSYTVKTLRTLAERYPDLRFRLVVGSDNWLNFSKWREPQAILDEFGVTVYPRPGYEVDPKTLPVGVTLLADAPQALISSTFIRKGIADGKSLRHFVDDRVLQFIEEHGLYSNGGADTREDSTCGSETRKDSKELKTESCGSETHEDLSV